MSDNEIRLICPQCGDEAKEDKTKSTDNWKVYNPKCSKCNVNYKMEHLVHAEQSIKRWPKWKQEIKVKY